LFLLLLLLHWGGGWCWGRRGQEADEVVQELVDRLAARDHDRGQPVHHNSSPVRRTGKRLDPLIDLLLHVRGDRIGTAVAAVGERDGSELRGGNRDRA